MTSKINYQYSILTLSIKACSNWGESISEAMTKPMISISVYMKRVAVDSLICGKNRQHRPQEAGPHQHRIWKLNKKIKWYLSLYSCDGQTVLIAYVVEHLTKDFRESDSNPCLVSHYCTLIQLGLVPCQPLELTGQLDDPARGKNLRFWSLRSKMI